LRGNDEGEGSSYIGIFLGLVDLVGVKGTWKMLQSSWVTYTKDLAFGLH